VHKPSNGDGGGAKGIPEFRGTSPPICPPIEVWAVGTRPLISHPMEMILGGGTVPQKSPLRGMVFNASNNLGAPTSSNKFSN